MTTECSVRWKGALYGINYENWWSNALCQSSCTLLELCCQVIVRDANFTRTAVAVLPYKLRYSLMRAAIERVEPFLQLVIHTIAERLGHNDCSVKLHVDNLGTSSTKRPHLATTECACEPYVIRMDCFIRNDSILDKLYHALNICHTSKCHLKLEVTKIDAVCLGERHVAKLLTLLDPEMIQGMGLEYNAFCNEGLIHLGLQISKFTHLTALDLSCNNLKFSEDGQVCSSLGQVLQNLTKLERLDLSNNKLSSALATLLSCLANTTLEFLKLSACQLKDEDVEYLARCPYIGDLRELDLSENFFASRIKGLIRLLGNVRNSLQVLELEDCGFTGAQFPYLVGSICHICGLRYLNIARNKLTADDLCEGLPNLRILPYLECIRLSSTSTWLDRDSNSTFQNERGKRHKVERVMEECIKRIPVLVVWDDHCMDD